MDGLFPHHASLGSRSPLLREHLYLEGRLDKQVGLQ